MLAYFAYTNDSTNQFDVAASKQAATLTEFQIDVSDVDTLKYVSAMNFGWTLLDGFERELKSRARFKSSFTTKPDLVLSGGLQSGLVMFGQTYSSYVLSVKEQLLLWAQSLSHWIYIPQEKIFDPTVPNMFSPNANSLSALPNPSLVANLPVLPYLQVKLSGEYSPEKFNGLLLGQMVKVEFTSSAAFDV